MDAPFLLLSRGAFYVVAALTVLGAWWVVTARSVFRAALALGLVLVGTAFVFIYLDADFLALAQLLLYVGAILVLVVFAIMLTARIGDATIPQANEQRWASAAVIGVLWATLASLVTRQTWPAPAQPPAAPTVLELGRALLTTYLLPFEFISVLFVAILVGALAIATPLKPSSK